MPGDAVPERVRWTVELLDVAATDRLLEIGCGGGAAVALVCPRLTAGHVLAIDRSATMTARALRRNAAHVDAGRAAIRTAALVDLPPTAGPFDKIFAINVNLFWTGPARAELALIRDLLAPGGALYVCYEPPGDDRTEEIIARVTGAVAASRFDAAPVRSGTGLAVIARPLVGPGPAPAAAPAV